MARVRASYIPALRFRWLSRHYDPLIAVFVGEGRWRPRFLEQIAPAAGDAILDMGCGTGTLLIAMAGQAPKARLAGLDVDPHILERARAKAASAGTSIEFVEGSAAAPPRNPALSRESFTKVTSSLMFHHLSHQEKMAALGHMHGLLRPGGLLHIADWGPPGSALMRLAFLPTQLLDGFETTRDNAEGTLPEMIETAGFSGVQQQGHCDTAFGRLCFYSARKAI